jgi:hypothetical protein
MSLPADNTLGLWHDLGHGELAVVLSVGSVGADRPDATPRGAIGEYVTVVVAQSTEYVKQPESPLSACRVWSPGIKTCRYQSIAWTDLSTRNFVTSSSKRECRLIANSLRETLALTSPMTLPF